MQNVHMVWMCLYTHVGKDGTAAFHLYLALSTQKIENHIVNV